MKITPTLRFLLVAMCLCMVFSLFACGEETTTITDAPATNAPTEEKTEEKTEAPTSEKTEAPTDEPTEAPGCTHEEVVIEGKAATCTEAGLTEGKKCAKCDEILVPQEEIPATGHKLDAGTPAENVACGEKATVTFKCENCDYTETKEGAVVEHDLEATVTTAATCTEKGKQTVTCKREGCTYSVEEEIAALGHKEETVAGKAATCTDKGLTDGKKCTVCEATIVEQTEIDALGHAKKDVAYMAPTTAEAGCIAHKACERCDAVWTTEDEETTADAISIPVIVPTSEKYLGVAELSKLVVGGVKGSLFAVPEASADRTYVRFARAGQSDDGNVMFLEGNTEVTGQYLVMKYRTDHMRTIEVWANTTENGHSGGKSMFGESTNADGEWHIVIMDLSKRLSGYVKADGEGKYTVQWGRVDILNGPATEGYIDLAWVIYCDDITDIKFAMTEEDNAICPHVVADNPEFTDKGDYHAAACIVCGGESKYSHSISTEPVYDGEAKLYKGACACGKELTSEMLYITEASAAQGGTNCVTVTEEDGFVRYAATKEGNKDLYMHIYSNGIVKTGKYMVIKYRLSNQGSNATLKQFFAGSSSSANTGAAGNGDQNVGTIGTELIGDGEWHYMIVFPKDNNTQFTDDAWKYLRIGFNTVAYDGTCYLDIDEIAFADNLNAAEYYAFSKEPTPVHKVNFDQSNCKITGTEGSILEKSVSGTHIAVDMTGKTLTSPTSLYLGGWCVTPGGCKAYKINVIKIDGEAVEEDMFDWIKPGDCEVDNGITKVGTGAGWSEDCRLGATTGGSKPVDLSAYAGHTIDFEIVVETNLGQSFTWATFTNVVVPAAAAE